MKNFRLLDLAILAIIAAAAAGLVTRAVAPDRVASVLTDLSRREEFQVKVAVPNPWRRPPLSRLPVAGDEEIGSGGRDRAIFRRFETESDSYPVAVFTVRARVDSARRRWFNYGEVIPGANFFFRTGRYRMEGVILEVLPDTASGQGS